MPAGHREGTLIMREILGKVDGLKNTVLNELEQLYDQEIPDWQVLTAEALEKMASITAAINREVNIYVDRHGKVVSVAVGDSSTVTLPALSSVWLTPRAMLPGANIRILL